MYVPALRRLPLGEQDADVRGRSRRPGVANTGLRSTSAISGKSCDQLGDAGGSARPSASRSTGVRRRARPRRISAAPIPSSIDSASSAVDRRQPEGDVLEDLDQHAAEPEGDDLAERRVGDRADDAPPARAAASLLHLHAVRCRASGVVRTRVGDDLAERGCVRRPRSDTPTTTPPASVLCRMSGETIFITTGKPSRVGAAHRLVGGLAPAPRPARDPVRVGDPLALGRGQRACGPRRARRRAPPVPLPCPAWRRPSFCPAPSIRSLRSS